MIDLALKPVIISGLFIGFYQLVLNKEKMFRFNRWYLLVTLVLSFVLPFLKLGLIDLSFLSLEAGGSAQGAATQAAESVSSFLNQSTAVWIVAASISLVLLIRFMINLWRLYSCVNRNEKITKNGFTLVKVKDPVTPFSFLKYIFVADDQVQNGRVQPEIFSHEYAHVSQRHTYDILLIELLLVFFWFNPFLYIYRRSIIANHEYLADEAVLKKGADIAAYQYLLLETIAVKPQSRLSHSFYQATKKRLLLMTRETSANKARLLKIGGIAIVLAIVFVAGNTIRAKADAWGEGPAVQPNNNSSSKPADSWSSEPAW